MMKHIIISCTGIQKNERHASTLFNTKSRKIKRIWFMATICYTHALLKAAKEIECLFRRIKSANRKSAISLHKRNNNMEIMLCWITERTWRVPQRRVLSVDDVVHMSSRLRCFQKRQVKKQNKGTCINRHARE